MYCAQCGKSVTEGARFCSVCGVPVGTAGTQPRQAADVAAVAAVSSTAVVEQQGSPFTFFPVATHKFIILSFCTFSIYEFYWFYKNWQRLAASQPKPLSPFWRAAFAPLFAFSFFRQVRQRAEAVGASTGGSDGGLAALYFILSGLWRLPDPWWLISLGSVVALVPAVQVCQAINSAASNPDGLNNQYTAANVATIVIGGLLLILAIVGTVNPDWAG